MRNIFCYTLLAVLVFFTSGCDFFHHTKDGKPVMNKAIKAPVAISFLDANRLLSIRIPSVKVTLTDAKGQVVTPNNLSFTSMDVPGGVLSLGLKESTVYSRDNPYSFSLQAEAPGYMMSPRSVVITNDSAQYMVVFMTKIDDPPPGMAGFAGSIQVKNSSVITTTTLVPKTSNKVQRKVSVRIAEGTMLMSNDKPIDQKLPAVEYRFVYASPSSIPALRTFPGSNGGTLITDAVDSAGKPIASPRNPMSFISTGWMTLEMSAGNRKITGFNKPVELNMPVEATSINPATREPYKPGDLIPTWSLDEKHAWKREGTAPVRQSSDGLIAVITVHHLSVWNIDNTSPLCSSVKVIPYNNTSGGVIPAYCELIQAKNGVAYGLYPGSNPIVSFNTPSGHHNIINAPSTGDLSFLVYNTNVIPLDPHTVPVMASSNFNCGNTPPTLNLSAPSTAAIRHVNVRFAIREAGQPDLTVCHNAVFFLPSGSGSPGAAFVYGGNLAVTSNAAGTYGSVTLYQNGPFQQSRLQLFYGGVSGGSTVAQIVEFGMDFTTPPSTSMTAALSPTPSGIQYQHINDGADDYFLVVIPAAGMPVLSACL